jgi:hypothetical protein
VMRCSNIKKYEHPQTNLIQGIVELFSNQISRGRLHFLNSWTL